MRRMGSFGRLLLGVCIWTLGAGLLAAGHAREAGAAVKEGKLSLSLPEVVIESVDIARLVARRVRPQPPQRLGVNFPDVLAQAEMPETSPPARPIPPERKSDSGLPNVLGGLSRIFADDEKRLEIGLGYLEKDSPVEAGDIFDRLAADTGNRRVRAAALFWGAEARLRLERPEEALDLRRRLLGIGGRGTERYVAAARYALAEERCGAGGYAACLQILDGGAWAKGTFASEEGRFLRAWALGRQGKKEAARDIYSALAEEGGGLALRALVALGKVDFRAGRFAESERAFERAASMGPSSDPARAALLGEALHGIGWARLRLGQAEAGGRAFSAFLERHRNHVLHRSAEVGSLSARIETTVQRSGEVEPLRQAVDAFAEKYPESQQIGALRLQLAWALFRKGDYAEAARLSAAVSDVYALGRVYRLGRVVEGLSRYHLGKVKEAYGVLRLGADRPPLGATRSEERTVARSAALATAFAAFRLKDFSGARAVLEHWAFPGGLGPKAKTADADAALWYGEAAFESGDLEGARLAFGAIPRGEAAWYRAKAGLAWIHYSRKDWVKAAKAFDEVFTVNPRGPLASEALARAGEARFNAGDHEGALRAFEKIEREAAEGAVAQEALLQKGKLLFRRGQFEQAREAFQRYAERYPESPAAGEVEYLRALIPFRGKKYGVAREGLLGFVDRHPKSPYAPDAFLRVGDAFYNEGNFLQADRIYRLMMTRFPGHPRTREAAYGLILTRLQRNQHEYFLREARAFIERYARDDLSISLAFQIGEVYLARNDLDGALRAYQEVVTRYAESDLAAHALLRAADIHWRRKNLDGFLATIDTLLARYPKSPLRADALFRAGEVLADVGRCAEARSRLTAFLERYPGHGYKTLAQFELGRCAAKLGDNALALSNLRKVTFEENNGEGMRSRAALLLAALLTREKKLEEAERALDVAIRSEDRAMGAEAFFSRAELRQRRGDPGAAGEFIKLTYRYPDQKIWVVRALDRAGDLYERAGRRSTALRIFQKMRQVAPAGALRDKAEAAIRRLGGASSSKPPKK